MNKLTIIGCDRSAGEALRLLGAAGFCLPEGVTFLALPCGGSLDMLHILRALEAGAQHVLVLSCFADACRSFQGDIWAEKRVLACQELLNEAGLDGRRVSFRQISPNMPADLATWIHTLLDSPLEPAQGQITP